MAIVALDARGTDIAAFDFPDRFILLPGIEGPGLPAELRRSTVSVPIAGAVESLNAYAALSIALYERARRARP
ncbi:MAG: SpoU rRNA Methylase family protein [bacterium ADurb.Bin429]|nr:MAG: SpoU rRNA Methylase family protein [bacterium ADurb.Bin429]